MTTVALTTGSTGGQTLLNNAFSQNVLNGPNGLIAAAQTSPYLAGLINTFAANGGHIVFGAAGTGTKSSKDANGVPTITIDSSWLPGGANPENPLTFATTFAHELGHMDLPSGYGGTASNPAQATANGDTNEGVALTAEYIVAQQLSTTMHSDQGQNPNGVALTPQLNTIAQQAGVDVTSLTFNSMSPFIAPGSSAVTTAGNWNGGQHPSGMPGITYDQYNADWWIIGNCSTIPPGSVNWALMQPSTVQYTNTANGCSINANSIPLLPVNGSGTGGTGSINGTISPSGAPISLVTSESDGPIQYTQTDTTNSAGQTAVAYNGQGGVIDLSNSTLTLAAGSQATLTGSGNTVTGNAGSTLALASSSNSDIVTMGSNGAVSVADGDHGEVINQTGGTVTLGNSTNTTIVGSNVQIGGGTGNIVSVVGNDTVSGTNDYVYLASNENVTVNGTGMAVNTSASDVINGSGALIRVGGNGGGNTANTTVVGNNDSIDDLGSKNTLSVVGTNQTVQNDAAGTAIYLGSSTSVTDKGSNNIVNTAAGDAITATGDTVRVGGNGGGNTAVTTVLGGNDVINDLGTTNTVAVVGNNQTIQNDAAGTAIYLGAGTSVTDQGTHDVINTAASDAITATGDTVYVGGNGGGNTAVTTVLGGSDIVDDRGTNGTLAVVGSNQTVQNDAAGTAIYLGAGTSVTDKGTNDVINTAASDAITATGDTVYVGANGGGNTAVTTVLGGSDIIDDRGTNNTLAVVGTNQTVQNDAQGSIYLGSNTSITDKGTGDGINTAAGDTIVASGDTIRVGNNLAAGQSAGNTIVEGNDTIYGGTGNTLLVQGNDTIYGNSDTVYEFNSAAQETDQLYLDAAGKESFDAKFTPGAAYSYEEDKFNDSGNQIEADKFNAGNGQLSETDLWNGSSPYVAEKEIANGGSYYSEIDSFNAAGNEIQAEKFNQTSGQLSEIISWDGTHPYATQEEFSNGGSYFSEVDNFNSTTGAETSGGQFNSQTGTEVDYYNNGSWYSGNQNYSDSSDSGYTDNGDAGYTDSGSECEGEDPVILNLQGGKVQTASLSGSNAYFDMTNDGQKVQTGWATAGEGMLVYDPNNTGTVTNDSNLVAGFAQLSMLAKQTGGVLNASNPLWNELKVWVDPTGTANFQKGQLETLDQLGITSINLNSIAENVNSNGNTILNDSTFTWKNGVTGDIAGVNLAFNPIAATTSPATSGSNSGGLSSGSLNHLIQSMAAFTDGNTGIDPTFSSRNAIADTFHLAASHAVQHA